MKSFLKSLLCLATLSLVTACGVDDSRSPPPPAPAPAHAPQAVPGARVHAQHDKDLINVNLGGCGDSDDNSGGLIHVNLGGGDNCCYQWGCGGGGWRR